MPRHPRAAPGGYVYHCLNRAVARLPLFQKDGDYDAFERVLGEALELHPIRMLAYCIMPNHWHFVVWPDAKPLRANLVAKAEQWRWSSLHQRHGKGPLRPFLHPWPVPLPRDWLARVQRPETEAELEAVRRAIHKGQPFGSETWQAATAKTLGLEFTFRQRGRPKKEGTKDQ